MPSSSAAPRPRRSDARPAATSRSCRSARPSTWVTGPTARPCSTRGLSTPRSSSATRTPTTASCATTTRCSTTSSQLLLRHPLRGHHRLLLRRRGVQHHPQGLVERRARQHPAGADRRRAPPAAEPLRPPPRRHRRSTKRIPAIERLAAEMLESWLRPSRRRRRASTRSPAGARSSSARPSPTSSPSASCARCSASPTRPGRVLLLVLLDDDRPRWLRDAATRAPGPPGPGGLRRGPRRAAPARPRYLHDRRRQPISDGHHLPAVRLEVDGDYLSTEEITSNIALDRRRRR